MCGGLLGKKHENEWPAFARRGGQALDYGAASE